MNIIPNSDQFASLIRTGLTLLAAYLVKKGFVDIGNIVNGPDMLAVGLLIFKLLWSHIAHARYDTTLPAQQGNSRGRVLAIVTALGLALAASATAQTTNSVMTTTNIPNLLPALSLTNLTGAFSLGNWGHAIEDGVQFIEGTTNSGTVQVEVGVLYGETTHDVGGFVDVMLPVAGTNSLFGAGFGVAYIGKNFYDATLNARLGTTETIPFLNIPAYTYLESGAGYNISKGEAVAQAFAGATIPFKIGSGTFTIGGAVGTIAGYAGEILAIGGSYTWKW